MRKILRACWIALGLTLAACSGFLGSWPAEGRVVAPGEVAKYQGGGSMSTLWYYGSDADYHYFAHFVKTATRYRVRREDLQLPDEFPYQSRQPVSVGGKPYWKNL